MSRILQVLVLAGALGSVMLRAQTPDATQTPPPATAIDPTKLGVSFDRVRMELSHPAPSKNGALKIHEIVQVVGTAPPILLWDPKTIKANLTSAAVPYGAPTQKDIMKLIVPKEFQNYPMDLNALMQWLAEHLNKKSE